MGRRVGRLASSIFTAFIVVTVITSVITACTDNFINEIKKKVEDESAPRYKVVYNGNGEDAGEVPVDPNEYKEGDTVTVLGNPGSLTKSGYVFVGWNTKADGSGTEYGEGETFGIGAGDITLYARWVVEIAKLYAQDETDNWWFGYSVAISGNYAAIGCGREFLYVFRMTDYNTWDDGTRLYAAGGQNVVAIDGDYVVSGSKSYSSNTGKVKVFHRTDSGWGTGVAVDNPNGGAGAGDYFGCSVGINGDYIVIGAEGDGSASHPGAAYVHHRNGINSWGEEVKLVEPAEYAAVESHFGNSVDISGNYVIVGAELADVNATDTGSAYIFYRTGGNDWSSVVRLVASDGEANDRFGSSVAIDGDYAVVGAVLETHLANEEGAAYVFHRTGENSWDSGFKLIAPDALGIDNFGSSVAIDGNYIAIGSRYNSELGNHAGAVYIFKRTGTNEWAFSRKILAPDGSEDDRFGWSVGISGSYVIGGADMNDVKGFNAGVSYVKLIGNGE